MVDQTTFQHSVKPSDSYGPEIIIRSPSGQEFVQRNYDHDRGGDARTDETGIDFYWNFDTSPQPNWGVARIYNVDNNTIKGFKRGFPIELECGWLEASEHARIVLSCTISNIREHRQNKVVRAADIYFVDSVRAHLADVTSRSFPPGTAFSEKFNTLVGDLGIPFDDVRPAQDGVYKDGSVSLGRIWPELRRTALDMRSKLYIYNGAGYLLPPDEGYETGLKIGPVQLHQVRKVQMTQEVPDAPLFVGYDEGMILQSTMLFEAGMRPDAIFELGSFAPLLPADKAITDDAPGIYRVVRGRHQFDGRSLLTVVLIKPVMGLVRAGEESLIPHKYIRCGAFAAPETPPSGPAKEEPSTEPQGENPLDGLMDLFEKLAKNLDLDKFMDMLPRLPDIDLDAIRKFGEEMLDKVKNMGLEMAKNFVKDALNSVVPASVLEGVFKAAEAVISGNPAAALEAVVGGVIDQIPGASTAKALLAMAAPFMG